MRKALRSLVAVCLMVAFSFLAFSPGAVSAAEKAMCVAVANCEAPSIQPVAAGGRTDLGARTPTRAAKSGLIVSVIARPDGYLNWRMRDTTRNV